MDTRMLAVLLTLTGTCLAQPLAEPPLTPSQGLAVREVAAWNELPTDDRQALAERMGGFVKRFVGTDPLHAVSLTRSAVLGAGPVVWDGFISATTEVIKRLALETDDATHRQRALIALTGLADAERLRPPVADAAFLDSETRAHLEKQLPAVSQFPNQPRRVLPPGPPGATEVAAEGLPLKPDPRDPRTAVAALAEQRELYQSWQHALDTDPRRRASPLDPAWDAEDPIVKALKATLDRFEALGDAGLAADAGATREDRKAALRRLASGSRSRADCVPTPMPRRNASPTVSPLLRRRNQSWGSPHWSATNGGSRFSPL